MNNLNYEEIELDKLTHLFNGSLILLVTATDIETEYTHGKLKPLNGYKSILRSFEGNYTYYFGLFGHYVVAHVQCAMGSVSRDSSIMTISTAIQKLKTNVVIMIGIAFGVNENKQKIGDVLVSESVRPYNIRRVGEKDTICRGVEAPASQLLLNRFKSFVSTWEHIIDSGLKSNLIFGRILSGEELVDNIEYRNKLLLELPDSDGGEMEGAGLYAACGNKIDWILVKGICDFADGKKGVNKKQNQKMAVEAALSVCSELFNSFYAFQDINIQPVNNIADNSLLDNLTISNVLFDYYDASNEKYYIQRAKDDEFNDVLRHYCVWVYGPSGSGKSNLIIRNLIQNKVPHIQVNLAPYIGQDVESFFKEILYEISASVEGVYSQIQPQSFADCSKSLIFLLDKHYRNKELYIFVEEIPINSEKEHQQFAEKIFSLIISKSFNIGLTKIRFVLSSIEDPKLHITMIQQKIHQQMHFLQLNYWQEEEIVTLIDIILKEFKISLKPEFKVKLVNAAKGSPRYIKKFFRSVYTLNKTDDISLSLILRETTRDLNF